MRFLFGLIIGAVATVMLAPKLASLSPAALQPIEDTLLAVAAHTSMPSSQTAGQEATLDATDSPLTNLDAALPERAADLLPLPQLAAPVEVTTTPNETAREASPVPLLTELSQEQSVWVPFRSEVSARGFAGKLSEQLERPFQVLRAGPGQYLVVFGYRSEAERSEVLAQIHALTGYTQL